ncbi:uncharacterized protein MELLADRAFT_72677 [Melampsora larici-populina 98AG31]|uniref:CBF1-interacting co-repressor CIR N-terminal domain-containing protein n=1 Tax=Melampsora larici-populina (strain 98AG31 / pathotype 3-4-7) TaxID=747676 RepID=F4RXG3_MELLP|nr:uncharacterized protein MELLADRAFT_72677 [Melampsora larici-populina 98AG31]EGG02992.1 hypothetical protein MELLADRAFT_72677 [Melampsora larici-populina 98AG31]
MGKLNILYHKSYHVYNRENVERVKRDELKAELEAEAKTQSTIAANSEARLTLLRSQKDQIKSESGRKKERRIEKVLEDQLKGKKPASPPSRDEPSKRSTDNSSIIDPKNGHINFWSSLENQSTSKQFENSKILDQNESHVRDRKKADEKWDAMITMRLDRPAHELKPWYSQSDLTNGEDKKQSERKIKERSSKDKQLKNTHDPLSSVQTYLHQRESGRSGSSILPSLPTRRSWKKRQASRSPSPPMSLNKRTSDDVESDEDCYMPSLPPVSHPESSNLPIVQIVRVDSDAERRKAQALIASHRAPSEQGTPMAHADLYNRNEMREIMAGKRRGGDNQRPRDKRTRYWDS